jgi:hypothetical protein
MQIIERIRRKRNVRVALSAAIVCSVGTVAFAQRLPGGLPLKPTQDDGTLTTAPILGLRLVSPSFFKTYAGSENLGIPIELVYEAANQGDVSAELQTEQHQRPNSNWILKVNPREYSKMLNTINSRRLPPREDVVTDGDLYYSIDLNLLAQLPETELFTLKDAKDGIGWPGYTLSGRSPTKIDARYILQPNAGAIASFGSFIEQAHPKGGLSPLEASRNLNKVLSSIEALPKLMHASVIEVGTIQYGQPFASVFRNGTAGVVPDKDHSQLYLVCMPFSLSETFHTSNAARLDFTAEFPPSTIARGAYPLEKQAENEPPAEPVPHACGPNYATYESDPRIQKIGIQTSTPTWRIEDKAVLQQSQYMAAIVGVRLGATSLGVTFHFCVKPKPSFAMSSDEACAKPQPKTIRLPPPQ